MTKPAKPVADPQTALQAVFTCAWDEYRLDVQLVLVHPSLGAALRAHLQQGVGAAYGTLGSGPAAPIFFVKALVNATTGSMATVQEEAAIAPRSVHCQGPLRTGDADDGRQCTVIFDLVDV